MVSCTNCKSQFASGQGLLSRVYSMNRRGLITQPCGAPVFNTEGILPPIQTGWSLFARESNIQCRPLKPRVLSWPINFMWESVLNAELKYKNQNSVFIFKMWGLSGGQWRWRPLWIFFYWGSRLVGMLLQVCWKTSFSKYFIRMGLRTTGQYLLGLDAVDLCRYRVVF